jgi:hypothetical protein
VAPMKGLLLSLPGDQNACIIQVTTLSLKLYDIVIHNVSPNKQLLGTVVNQGATIGMATNQVSIHVSIRSRADINEFKDPTGYLAKVSLAP